MESPDLTQVRFEFAHRWNVFRDSSINGFFRLFLIRRSQEILQQMENCDALNFPKLQGQLTEVRRLQTLFVLTAPEAERAMETVLSLK